MAPEQDTTTTKAPPESLLTALERLERLVLLLGKLIPHAMRHFSDVSIVADALHVLAPASSVEFPLFSSVARRSFSLLHQWSLSSGTSKPVEKGARQQSELRQSPMEGVEAGGSELQADGEGASLDRRLQGMARASVCIRNRAMLRRYLHDSRNEEARRMAKVALQTIALIHPIHDGADQVAGEESSDADDLFPWDGDDDDNVKSTKSLQRTLLQLVRLVAHTGDDPELNMLLSRAMMGVCSSLGFSEIP
ncbi:unnamed protein product [Trypanosoma congolense IL3000]|nr:unnamed protein product [Trypanosoma congolense IL3000]